MLFSESGLPSSCKPQTLRFEGFGDIFLITKETSIGSMGLVYFPCKKMDDEICMVDFSRTIGRYIYNKESHGWVSGLAFFPGAKSPISPSMRRLVFEGRVKTGVSEKANQVSSCYHRTLKWAQAIWAGETFLLS